METEGRLTYRQRNKMLKGVYIRRERRRLDLTLAQLAKGICHVSYLSRIENGSRPGTVKVLEALLSRLQEEKA